MSENATENKNAERDAALRKAYGTATKKLREKFVKEFNEIYAVEAKALGQEWKPKKSKKDKAAETLAALLAEFPELTSEVAEAVAGGPSAASKAAGGPPAQAAAPRA